jgi:hypothetical protein
VYPFHTISTYIPTIGIEIGSRWGESDLDMPYAQCNGRVERLFSDFCRSRNEMQILGTLALP